jgi:hypothetical protein
MRHALCALLFASLPGNAAAQDDLSFAVELGERVYVVLSQEPDPAWASGEARVVAADELSVATSRRVERRRLPAPVSSALRERWVAFGTEGAPCSGALGGPVELAMIDSQYREEGQTDHEIVESREPFARYLAAPLRARCADGVRFAHPASRTPHARYERREMSQVETERAIAALRVLPDYLELQREYEEYAGDPENHYDGVAFSAHWDGYDGAAPHAHRIVDARSGRSFVVAGAQSGYGCGMFVGELCALFAESDSGALSLVETGRLTPMGFVDIEGDGVLERLGGDWYARGGEERWIQREPFICPC